MKRAVKIVALYFVFFIAIMTLELPLMAHAEDQPTRNHVFLIGWGLLLWG